MESQPPEGTGKGAKIVYIWDMDETIILLKSLLNGSYAGGFNGAKDVQKGIEIGKMWEKHILQICDDHFFYEQVENYNSPSLDALVEYDDGRDLGDYDFTNDNLGTPADDLNKRKLAYRYRTVSKKYQQGLRNIVDRDAIREWNELYEMTDKFTDGWLSSGDGWEECEAAQVMKWPFIQIDLDLGSSHKFPGLTLKTVGHYISVIYGNSDTADADHQD
ncbi:unnamed protein product [Rhodiola kirilowii]